MCNPALNTTLNSTLIPPKNSTLIQVAVVAGKDASYAAGVANAAAELATAHADNAMKHQELTNMKKAMATAADAAAITATATAKTIRELKESLISSTTAATIF